MGEQWSSSSPEAVWGAAFEEVCERIGPIFARSETRERARAYLRGLLSPIEHKNGWQMAKHPEVEIVSRDRGGVYIDGATLGAPQATQVADRWHILSNLGEAVEEFLIRAHVRLQEPAEDWGRTGPGPQYRAQVRPTSPGATTAHATSVTRKPT